jgi:hypothetical protein
MFFGCPCAALPPAGHYHDPSYDAAAAAAAAQQYHEHALAAQQGYDAAAVSAGVQYCPGRRGL